MSQFTVDLSKCKGDGVCSAICPVYLIKMEDNKPVRIKGADEMCINCGHCVAVCPHGAVLLDSMKPEQCKTLDPGWKMDPEKVSQLLKGRRSIRRFQEKKVEKNILEKVIEMARYAPTGANTQSVNWKVIYDSREINRLAGLVIDWMKKAIKENLPMAEMLNMKALVLGWRAGLDVICRNAPHLIVTFGGENDRMNPQSSTIALSYLELAALPYELGTCWAGYFQIAAAMSPDFQAALKLPEKCKSTGAMLIGYPEYQYQRIPLRKKPEIVWG